MIQETKVLARPLYMVLELDSFRWHLGFATALAQPLRTRSIAAGDIRALYVEIENSMTRLCGSATPSEIVSCYEAGRDGFWIHRLLTERGFDRGPKLPVIPIRNVIVEPASLPVSREARRAKSDSIDRAALMRQLVRWNDGDSKAWRVINVPSRDDENLRLLERELGILADDRTRERNRISSALKLHGVTVRPRSSSELEAIRTAEGRTIPLEMVTMIRRGFERIELIEAQIAALDAERRRRLAVPGPRTDMTLRLMQLVGLGEIGSSVLVHELLAWRRFRNRRQVGSAAGLCPTPYASGRSHREQGINRAGNRRVRKILNQQAWIWLRHQPDSSITRWFEARFAHGGPRARKIGITAVSRKLLIAFWRYIDQGLIPDGARLKKPNIRKSLRSQRVRPPEKPPVRRKMPPAAPTQRKDLQPVIAVTASAREKDQRKF